MVGQDVNALHTLATGDEGAGCANIFFIIVDSRDQGDANPDRMAVVAQCLKVTEDQFVANAGESLVDFTVHMFNII